MLLPPRKLEGYANAYLLRIADSSRLLHDEDTRTDRDGFGFGTILLVTDLVSGEPTAYGWVAEKWTAFETAIALGTLRRQGFAVSAFLVGLDETARLEAHGRLLAETVRDIRYVNSEEELAALGGNTAAPGPAAYAVDIPMV